MRNALTIMNAVKTSIAGVFEALAAVKMSIPKIKMIPEICPARRSNPSEVASGAG